MTCRKATEVGQTDLKFRNRVLFQLLVYYLSVTARAAIGEFSEPYFIVRRAKIQSCFVAKIFRDLSPSVHRFYSK